MAQPQLTPKYQLNRNSRPPQGMTQELEQQKALMEKQLRDRAQRLSRISMKLQSTGGNNLSNKLKEFEVQQMAQQLAELHDTMKGDEAARRDQERMLKQREDEARAMAQRTQQMEQMYKQMDPKSADPMLDAKAQKRRTALLSMKATGAFSDQELSAMEAKERAQEEQDILRARQQQELTEKRLRDMEMEVKKKEREREAERLKRQQEQLRQMELNMANMEKALEGGGDDYGVDSEAALQREIERRQREAKERREKERKERERIMLEEERIRRERDDAVFQKKLDMERRMREMEQLLAEKQREKEEAIMRKKQEKIAEMERQLREMDSAAGMEDEYNTALTDVEARKWQAKAQALEDQLRSGGGGGGGGLSVAQEQALAAREAELAARAKQMEGMMAKLDKLDQLEGLVSQLAKLAAGGFAMGGGGGMGMGGGGGMNTVADLKKTIEEQQKILFDPKSTDKQIEEANIKLEKAMGEYEKTGEYQQEQMRLKAERRAKHEGPNKEALKKLKQIYNPANVKSNPDLLAKIGDNPELRLLFMEHETILKLHQNDFKAFSLRGLSLEEMRAIRANLPQFRKDQKVQLDWTEGLDNKIEERSENEHKQIDKPIAPKSGKPLKLPKAKPGAGGGDIFAELLARKNGAKAGGGGGMSSGSAPAMSATPLPTKLPPLPKMSLPPPGPPGSGMAAASAPSAMSGGGAPKAAAPAKPPTQQAIDQYKKVKGCLERLLKGLVGGSASEKDIATDTRTTVQEIKALAKIQKPLFPEVCGECEDSASELVVAVKAVLVAKKAGGADLNLAKQKLAQVIETVRNLSIKTLGPDGKNYIK